MPANDKQYGGTHYKTARIEPWDYIIANKIGFLEGNAIKYLTRWREKGGVLDLQKALHYVEKAIEVENASTRTRTKRSPTAARRVPARSARRSRS